MAAADDRWSSAPTDGCAGGDRRAVRLGGAGPAVLGTSSSCGPFPPFPPEIARDTDMLEITRTWTFTNDKFRHPQRRTAALALSDEQPDKYAVVGNRSRTARARRSPAVRAADAPVDRRRALRSAADGLRSSRSPARGGLRGLNVTIPFKLDAAKLRPADAGGRGWPAPSNTLKFDGEAITGDNTDASRFVRDVTQRLKFHIQDSSILVSAPAAACAG